MRRAMEIKHIPIFNVAVGRFLLWQLAVRLWTMDFSPVRHIPAKNDNVSEYLLNFRIISMAAANHAAEGRQPVNAGLAFNTAKIF